MKAFFLTLFLIICCSVSAQVDAFQQDIINYLNSNGTHQQYSDAYDGMFDVLKQNFEKAQVPSKVWVKLQQDKEKNVKEIISFLSFAYRNHFSQEEIAEMSSFYKTKAAQKLVSRTELSEEDNKVVSNYFASEVAKKVETKREVLSADINEISTHWSRDLFQSKMKELINQGYSPNQ